MRGRRWIGPALVLALVICIGSAGQSAAAVTAPQGYQAQRIVGQLSHPVGVAVGPGGLLYIAESGREVGTRPRVLRVMPGQGHTVVAADFPAPLTGITLHQGKLYVAYAGGVDLLDPATGLHHPVLSQLPGLGDHPNGAVVVGPDQKLYFGIGSATNAGVVGIDNPWVKTAPQFHDIPCRQVAVRGVNFASPNPLTPDPQDQAATGAFVPFGKSTARLQTIAGALPCTAAILRANADGSELELVAWGLRNPTGVAFGPDRQLYSVVGGLENRGSRPVAGDGDHFYKIEADRWYGWPDYAGGRPLSKSVPPLLTQAPASPPLPIASLAPGASGLLFPTDLRGDALVTHGGNETQPPSILRIDPRTGAVTPFLQSSKGDGLGRPVALAGGPGGSLYMVDAGQVQPVAQGGPLRPGTGAIWKVSPSVQAIRLVPPQIRWQWALAGLTLSLAGATLLRIRRED